VPFRGKRLSYLPLVKEPCMVRCNGNLHPPILNQQSTLNRGFFLRSIPPDEIQKGNFQTRPWFICDILEARGYCENAPHSTNSRGEKHARYWSNREDKT
jgi:hypothetical protein